MARAKKKTIVAVPIYESDKSESEDENPQPPATEIEEPPTPAPLPEPTPEPLFEEPPAKKRKIAAAQPLFDPEIIKRMVADEFEAESKRRAIAEAERECQIAVFFALQKI